VYGRIHNSKYFFTSVVENQENSFFYSILEMEYCHTTSVSNEGPRDILRNILRNIFLFVCRFPLVHLSIIHYFLVTRGYKLVPLSNLDGLKQG